MAKPVKGAKKDKASKRDHKQAPKKEGKAIIMISEELPELIGMSDRILIMKDGQITKEFARSKDLTQEEIVEYMI